MTFVGTPIQTSTPVGALGTPGPVTAFSYGTSDARTQPGGPQGPAVPASVPASTASPNIAIPAPAPTPAPPAAASYTSSSTPHLSARAHHSPTRPSATPHSPPHNPHSPPRTSSSPASVSDTRGPRPEPSRKSIPELERKLAHRKSSKFPDGPRGQHASGSPLLPLETPLCCWPGPLTTSSLPCRPQRQSTWPGRGWWGRSPSSWTAGSCPGSSPSA